MTQAALPLALDGVSKSYGGVAVVDGVSLDVPGGTFFSLLGPSGSGKTTLLMLVAGFAAPDRGRVRLGARDLTAVPPEARRFGMVFQGYALFPTMTAGENVAFPLRVRGVGRAERDARARAALDLVHLSGLEGRLPRQMSGGQQQRVALARALVFEPDLLLLDEPLSALDKKLRQGLQAELRDLQARVGRTFVCVTHDQEEALSMSDRIAILRGGRIAQEGTPRDLFEQPRSWFVADFLGDSNFIAGTAGGGAGDGLCRVQSGGTTLLQAGPAASAGSPLLLALRPSKIAVGATAPAAGLNRLEGTVRSANYHGTDVQARVETALGSLSVTAPTWGATLPLDAGRRVWLSWPPDAAVVVADDRP